jgi:glycosyltransferase involved in cell wall biosynthesis
MEGSEPDGSSATLCLVVPMFNEEERAAGTVLPLLDHIDRKPEGSVLVFVDDGSSDRTIEVVERAVAEHGSQRASVLARPHLGKGAAVRAGLLQASTTVAAFCDVDLATPLAEVDRLAAIAIEGSCLAIGSRGVSEARIEQRESLRREIAGKAYNRLVRVLCPGITDTQCGAKAATTATWRAILAHSREDGFAWDVEAIALAMRLSIPVREIGVEWHHDDRTRVRVLHDGLSMVLSVPRIGLRVRRAAAAAARTPQVAILGKRAGG